MVEYEKMFSRKLVPQNYGCPKLLKLLEQFPNTVEVNRLTSRKELAWSVV